MLTLEQIKESVSKRYGFNNWEDMDKIKNKYISDRALYNVVKIYSNERLNEAADFAENYSEIVADYILKLKAM